MLTRSTFKRPVYTPPPKAPLRPATRRAQYRTSDAVVVAIPKHEYIRSPKLLAAVRSLPCMVTGMVGQTEAAHSNWAVHHKAKAVKADDNRVAALCRPLHEALDQGSRLTERQRQTLWWNAHTRTVRALLALRLWPARVPVPDIENCPFDLESQ